tara:strand:- start:10251 stop:10955 length:705 start_codon:yes stop_codon:yes gene_type:complete
MRTNKKLSKSSLVLVRHGQSEWNKQDKFTGWVDVPLSFEGKKEAKVAGEKIKKLDISFDYLFCSILKRSIQTYQEIDKVCHFNNKLIKDWRLNERHYGNLQGLNKQEMRNLHGDEQVLKWRRSYNVKPPKINLESHKKLINQECYKKVNINPFPKNESLKDTVLRLEPFITKKLFPIIKSNKNIFISAHGNSIRAMLKYIENISNEDIIKIEIPTGEPMLLKFNDINLESKKYI